MRAGRLTTARPHPFTGEAQVSQPTVTSAPGHQFQGLLLFFVGLALTGGALAALGWWDPTASRPTEIAVLVVANLTATVIRFLALRAWVFTDPEASHRRQASHGR